jgi:hypothetical protein
MSGSANPTNDVTPESLLEGSSSHTLYSRRRLPGQEVHASTTVFAVHFLLFLSYLVWMVDERARTFRYPAIGIAILLFISLLVAGPIIIVFWEKSLHQLDQDLVNSVELGQETRRSIRQLQNFDRWKFLFSVLLIAFLTLIFFRSPNWLRHVGVPTKGPTFFYWYALMIVTGYMAGHFFWVTIKTIRLSIRLANGNRTYFPFAGTTSQLSTPLMHFCFMTSFLAGLSNAIVLPAAVATAIYSSGAARVVAVLLISAVIIFDALILGLPAAFLSRRVDKLRREYLDGLSEYIDVASAPFVQSQVEVDESTFHRLQGLLEMRRHVVNHAVPESSVEMIKRIPTAIFIPVSTSIAAWVTIIHH